MGQKMLLNFPKKLDGSIIHHSEYTGLLKTQFFCCYFFMGEAHPNPRRAQGELRWSTFLISFRLSFRGIIWCCYSNILMHILAGL